MTPDDKSYWEQAKKDSEREYHYKMMRNAQIRGYKPLDLKKPVHFGRVKKAKKAR